VTAADELRPLLFGNVPIDGWPAGDDATAEPWSTFVRARRHLANGDLDLAIRDWGRISMFDKFEPRHRLQAWTFLRANGIQPDESIACTVLGVVAELAIGGAHDVLATYADGSIRYLNHGGSALVVDSARYDLVLGASALLAVGQELADDLGPWAGPELPTLDPGESRFTLLTPGGPVIGQGPDAALSADPMAQPLYAAVTSLLLALLEEGPPTA